MAKTLLRDQGRSHEKIGVSRDAQSEQDEDPEHNPPVCVADLYQENLAQLIDFVSGQTGIPFCPFVHVVEEAGYPASRRLFNKACYYRSCCSAA